MAVRLVPNGLRLRCNAQRGQRTSISFDHCNALLGHSTFNKLGLVPAPGVACSRFKLGLSLPRAVSSGYQAGPFLDPRARRWFPRIGLHHLGTPITWTLILSYIFVMLLIPILALLSKASLIPPHIFLARATEPVTMSAYAVTFSMAFTAALFNTVFGFLLAWVLVNFSFPGRKWLDAAVDLPFALPTSVAGLTLTTVYSSEGIAGPILSALGIDVAYTRLGVAVAMTFVSFPFVVRTMQPVLMEVDQEAVEAAWSLGASPFTTFVQVILPPLLPALLTGSALAFSRALGEFGSVVIISSNFPFKDLIAPVLIFQCLEQYDYVGATVIGTVLLLASLAIMLCVNGLQNLRQAYKK